MNLNLDMAEYYYSFKYKKSGLELMKNYNPLINRST